MSIQEIIRRLNSFDIHSVIKDAVNINEDLIISLNKANLFKGEDSKGNQIGKYSAVTEGLTVGISGLGFPKKKGSPWNIFHSGETANSISINYNKGFIYFYNDSSIKEDLYTTILDYGYIENPKEIFGIQKDDIEKIINIFNNYIAERLNNKIKNDL